jgi:hypothetical protein
MDETVGDHTTFRVHRQEPVEFMEPVFVVGKDPSEIIRGVVVMMEMDLDFAVSGMAKLGKRSHILEFVFFLRVEKAVFEDFSLGVEKAFGDFWILQYPPVNAPPGGPRVRIRPIGFEVIADAKEDVCGPGAYKGGQGSFDAVNQAPRKPEG